MTIKEEIFNSKTDCYADTGTFENDGSYREGEVIRAITEHKFYDAFVVYDKEIKDSVDKIENVGLDCIEYVGTANYHERELEAKEKFRKAINELKEKLQ